MGATKWPLLIVFELCLSRRLHYLKRLCWSPIFLFTLPVFFFLFSYSNYRYLLVFIQIFTVLYISLFRAMFFTWKEGLIAISKQSELKK